MSKSRLAIEELLRGLSRLNGQAQDVLIHSSALVESGDYKSLELIQFTLEQAHKEAESLQIKLDKISTQLCLNKVVEVLVEPKPEPKVEVKPEPKVEPRVLEPRVLEPKVEEPKVEEVKVVGGEGARKPRIKIHIPEPKEKVDLKVSLPFVGRRRC
jgi:hypothetical protein